VGWAIDDTSHECKVLAMVICVEYHSWTEALWSSLQGC
jgi:hypothetical protein